MSLRVALVAGLLVWAGATLLLSGWSRFSRPSLADRLAPFHAGAGPDLRRTPQAAAAAGPPLADALRQIGDRLAAVLGVREGAERRLARVHSGMSAATFRARQAIGVAGAALVMALLATGLEVPTALSAFLVAGAATMAFLVVEQVLTSRSDRWRQATEAEIPVVAEQLAMLLGSGASLGAALQRMAARGRGCVSRDLELVVNRVAQGLSEKEALAEWSDRAGTEAVSRLVGVLTLHSEAADLGRLVTAEARRARRDLHRRTLEEIERRGQQVWIPVTVATLVPGTILLAVPFLAALRLFSST